MKYTRKFTDPPTTQASARRLLITHNRKDFYQFIEIKQGTKGDLYVFWTDSDQTKLYIFDELTGTFRAHIEDIQMKGKLTFHGSSETHFSPRENEHEVDQNYNVYGQRLYSTEHKEITTRHLCTLFLKEPKATAPVAEDSFLRFHDEAIHAREWHPVNLMLFAVPMTCDVLFKMEDTPGFEATKDFCGMGRINMRYHSVIWAAFKTDIVNWPEKNHVFYSNGFYVPFFGNDSLDFKEKLTMLMPKYSIEENQITIELSYNPEKSKD